MTADKKRGSLKGLWPRQESGRPALSALIAAHLVSLSTIKKLLFKDTQHQQQEVGTAFQQLKRSCHSDLLVLTRAALSAVMRVLKSRVGPRSGAHGGPGPTAMIYGGLNYTSCFIVLSLGTPFALGEKNTIPLLRCCAHVVTPHHRFFFQIYIFLLLAAARSTPDTFINCQAAFDRVLSALVVSPARANLRLKNWYIVSTERLRRCFRPERFIFLKRVFIIGFRKFLPASSERRHHLVAHFKSEKHSFKWRSGFFNG